MQTKKYCLFALIIFIFSCTEQSPSEIQKTNEKLIQNTITKTTSLVILGTIQDAGQPQIGCKKKCCKDLFLHPDHNNKVISLGLIDPQNKKKYIFEATPDFTVQTNMLKSYAPFSEKETPDGIFLTHAHIGHYVGLMYLGKEAMNADSIPVYAMPKMKNFLETSGPWSQLVLNKNISIQEMAHNKTIKLTSNISVIPFTVPHRDEYSETVGYKIIGPNKTALFIPDIDKWGKWETSIIEELKKVDYAFLDATFYSGEELNNRDISQIPHPFIIESMKKFEGLSEMEKKKIIFIHFNHTNPVSNPESKEAKNVLKKGFRIGKINDVFEL